MATLPRRLLIVATGNIANDDLLALIGDNLVLIVEAFDKASLVEINQTNVVIHDSR